MDSMGGMLRLGAQLPAASTRVGPVEGILLLSVLDSAIGA